MQKITLFTMCIVLVGSMSTADAADPQGRPFKALQQQVTDIVEGSVPVGSVDWQNIHNRPPGLDDGDDDTQLTEPQVENFVTNGPLDFAAGSTIGGQTISSGSHTSTLDWSAITGIPSDIADGDQNTLYNGSDFAISNQSCAPGANATGIDENGVLSCSFGTAMTQHYSVFAGEFVPGDETIAWSSDHGGSNDRYISACNIAVCNLVAPLHLPHQSTVTNLDCKFIDNDGAKDMEVRLVEYKNLLSSYYPGCGVTTMGASTAIRSWSDSCVVDVDNVNNAYALVYDLHTTGGSICSGGGSDCKIFTCTVTYN